MAHHLIPVEPFDDLMQLDPVRGFAQLLREFGRPALVRRDIPAIRLDIH
jgi:hypothetical protein